MKLSLESRSMNFNHTELHDSSEEHLSFNWPGTSRTSDAGDQYAYMQYADYGRIYPSAIHRVA